MLKEIFYKIFRYDADCVMKNIFEIFDTLNTGKVNQNEILWVFSMAMNGTGKFEKKLSRNFQFTSIDSTKLNLFYIYFI